MELKRRILIFFCTVMLCCATGCYDNVELTDIFIVTGLGFDKSESEGMTDYTFQIGKVQRQGKNGSDGAGSILILNATKASLLSAVDEFLETNSRKLFLSHNQTMIFGREQAEKGIEPYFDAFLRENEIRPEVWLVIADQKASEILETEIEPEKVSGITIGEVMKNRSAASEKLTMSVIEFISLSMDETSAPLVPICKVEDKDKESKLSFNTMAVLNQYRMIGELDQEEIDGFLWAMGGINKAELELKMKDGVVVLTPYTFKWKTEPTLNDDGSSQVKISISANMLIREIQGFAGKTMKESLPQMEQFAQNHVRELIMACFEKACSLNADIFSFGSAFNRKYPKQWEDMKEHWDKIFSKLKLETDIQIIVRDMGEIAKSGQMKEG